jgi:hypothetical protein
MVTAIGFNVETVPVQQYQISSSGFRFVPCNLFFALDVLLSCIRNSHVVKVASLFVNSQLRFKRRCYYPDTQAIIHVVDSSDSERMSIAREEFHAIL